MNLDLIERVGPKAITPDTPEEIQREIVKSPRFEQLRKAAEECARLRQVEMLRQQRLVAQDLKQTTHKLTEGLGQHALRIPQEEYHAIKAKYGEDCWSDPGFVDAYARDNPWAVPKITRGTKGNELWR